MSLSQALLWCRLLSSFRMAAIHSVCKGEAIASLKSLGCDHIHLDASEHGCERHHILQYWVAFAVRHLLGAKGRHLVIWCIRCGVRCLFCSSVQCLFVLMCGASMLLCDDCASVWCLFFAFVRCLLYAWVSGIALSLSMNTTPVLLTARCLANSLSFHVLVDLF